MRVILFSILTLIPGMAQTSLDPDDVRFRFGVKLGVQTLDSFDTAPGFNKEDSRFVGGGVVEMRLNDYFGGEVDALYRRFRFDAVFPSPLVSNVVLSTNRAEAIDFPVLFKWKPFGRRDVSPFVSSGVAFRYVNGRETRTFFAGENAEQEFNTSFAQVSSFNVGWVVAGGLIFERGVRISPELRYTVWGRDNFSATTIAPGSLGTFANTHNQLEVLVGVTF